MSAQHEFAAFCMKYPGESRYQMACQGSELIVGLGKMYCEKCGTGKFDMSTKLGNYYDITGTSMVFHNKVDFGKILKMIEQDKILLFDWNESILEEIKIQRLFPPMTDFITKIMDNYECGDDTSPFIRQILTQLNLDVWNVQSKNMSKSLFKSNCFDGNANDKLIDKDNLQYNHYIDQIEDLKQVENLSMKASLQIQASVVNQ